MAIDLELLERRIDQWLGKETEESIREWLLARRKNLSTSDEALPIGDVVKSCSGCGEPLFRGMDCINQLCDKTR